MILIYLDINEAFILIYPYDLQFYKDISKSSME